MRYLLACILLMVSCSGPVSPTETVTAGKAGRLQCGMRYRNPDRIVTCNCWAIPPGRYVPCKPASSPTTPSAPVS